MTGDIQLCPCCASHLRVPDQLHVMHCNTCDAELVQLNEGGVRGLALLPDAPAVPYSDPRQNSRHFDGRELLNLRRSIALRRAARQESAWCGLMLVTLGMVAGTIAIGAFGARSFMQGSPDQLRTGALALLCAISGLPVFWYVALYFQGRAKLAREETRKWAS